MSEFDTAEPTRPHWIDNPRNIAVLVLLQGAFGFAVGLTLWWATGRELSLFLSWRQDDLLVGASTTAPLIGAMLLIMLAVPSFLGWAAERQRALFAHGRRYSPAQILMISVGAGFGEEALFRGGLQTLLADHLPPLAALLLVSMVFAALHFSSKGIFVFVFAYGLAFGLVYHLTGSLLGVAIAHTVFDVWALTLVQRELFRRGAVA